VHVGRVGVPEIVAGVVQRLRALGLAVGPHVVDDVQRREVGAQVVLADGQLQLAKALAEDDLVLLREFLVGYYQQGLLVIRLQHLLPVGLVKPGQVDTGALCAGTGR